MAVSLVALEVTIITGKRGVDCFELFDQVQAGSVRQEDVEQNEIWSGLGYRVECLPGHFRQSELVSHHLPVLSGSESERRDHRRRKESWPCRKAVFLMKLGGRPRSLRHIGLRFQLATVGGHRPPKLGLPPVELEQSDQHHAGSPRERGSRRREPARRAFIVRAQRPAQRVLARFDPFFGRNSMGDEWHALCPPLTSEQSVPLLHESFFKKGRVHDVKLGTDIFDYCFDRWPARVWRHRWSFGWDRPGSVLGVYCAVPGRSHRA